MKDNTMLNLECNIRSYFIATLLFELLKPILQEFLKILRG